MLSCCQYLYNFLRRISGAALNPAVSLPLGLGSGKDPHWALVWFAAELAGAALAAGAYRVLRPEELPRSEAERTDEYRRTA